jgi:hypothetical protein
MKSKLFQLVVLLSLTPICGCFMADYKPGSKYSAPPGAYYVKPGMTKEERLRDWAACGGNSAGICQGLEGEAFAACKARCVLRFCFTKEEEEKASKEKAADEFMVGKNTDRRVAG